MAEPSRIPSTSETLLEQVRADEPRAWRELVRLYGPIVYRWARQRGLQDHDAADVVQNVFVAVARHLGGFSPEKAQGSFRSWLWTVTLNVVRELWRRQRVRPQAAGGEAAWQSLLTMAAESDEGSTCVPGDTRQALLREALAIVREESEPRTWRAFWGMAVEGLSANDLAPSCGMTPQGVRQAKYRILCRLRQLLADE